MAAPAAHQIEHAAARGQPLGVQAAERGDGSLVDVDDLARKAIEFVVRRLVVSRVGLGRKQIVTFPGLGLTSPLLSVGRQVYPHRTRSDPRATRGRRWTVAPAGISWL